MRDRKGFVQVQMADIGANLARFHQTNQRVHIGPVQIDLAAELMGNIADIADGFFKHPMGRGIGHHASRQPIPSCLGFGAEIFDINVAIRHRLHDDNLHPRHLRRSRIGAMRRHRDQADVAPRVTARAVIGGNGQKPGIFALRARVRLHRKRIIAGDFTKLFRQIADRLVIAKRLIFWHKGMQRAEFRPGDRHHFRRRVQLHRARPQRDHRTVQRQIAVRQAAHIAHHLGLGAVHVKHRMRHIVSGAQLAFRKGKCRAVRGDAINAKGL